MKTKGFTLIELLIVVAIIGILAAIAIPNFLAAQVRAKVAKAKAEMATIGTALETYAVDNSGYPLYQGSYYVPTILTTPVSYIKNEVSIVDPFRDHVTDPLLRRYRYVCETNYLLAGGYSATVWMNTYAVEFGKWKLNSAGPDRSWGPTLNPPNVYLITQIYDPSNGITSPGDIVRTQKFAEQKNYSFNR